MHVRNIMLAGLLLTNLSSFGSPQPNDNQRQTATDIVHANSTSNKIKNQYIVEFKSATTDIAIDEIKTKIDKKMARVLKSLNAFRCLKALLAISHRAN